MSTLPEFEFIRKPVENAEEVEAVLTQLTDFLSKKKATFRTLNSGDEINTIVTVISSLDLGWLEPDDVLPVQQLSCSVSSGVIGKLVREGKIWTGCKRWSLKGLGFPEREKDIEVGIGQEDAQPFFDIQLKPMLSLRTDTAHRLNEVFAKIGIRNDVESEVQDDKYVLSKAQNIRIKYSSAGIGGINPSHFRVIEETPGAEPFVHIFSSMLRGITSADFRSVFLLDQWINLRTVLDGTRGPYQHSIWGKMKADWRTAIRTETSSAILVSEWSHRRRWVAEGEEASGNVIVESNNGILEMVIAILYKDEDELKTQVREIVKPTS